MARRWIHAGRADRGPWPNRSRRADSVIAWIAALVRGSAAWRRAALHPALVHDSPLLVRDPFFCQLFGAQLAVEQVPEVVGFCPEQAAQMHVRPVVEDGPCGRTCLLRDSI